MLSLGYDRVCECTRRLSGHALSIQSRRDGDRVQEFGGRERAARNGEHHVLVVSGQDEFSVADHVRIGESFGDPYVHPFIDASPEHPAILQVFKEPDDTETFGGEVWHCDISFTSPPAAVSILHACELLPIGGDTLFANTALAFDRLSLRLRAWVSELTATHV